MATIYVLLSPEKTLELHQFLGNGLHGHFYGPLWI